LVDLIDLMNIKNYSFEENEDKFKPLNDKTRTRAPFKKKQKTKNKKQNTQNTRKREVMCIFEEMKTKSS
jgi:hypothetical protein